MALATNPDMASPWKGLDAFGEAERAVWEGREAERDALIGMVLAEGSRACLLFGELGVGKTSLVRAGLLPHLRDSGVVALACSDPSSPADSFARAMAAYGMEANSGEQAIGFLTRVVANSAAGQQFVFVVDDVDLACDNERAIAELADMFAKVVSRSAGRARFLFVAASERLHALGALERRTGSLFPPSNRFELPRLSREVALRTFERILSRLDVAADSALVDAVVQGVALPSGVLPADLQRCAMAMHHLGIASVSALHGLGGATALESAWLRAACAATGNERAALRLCAELATGRPDARSGADMARDIGVDSGFAHRAFVDLEQGGVVARGDPDGMTWRLRHEVLAPRLRELAAPAQASARRAFDLLGSKTSPQARLSLGELYTLHREGIAPVTPGEVELVRRSMRHYAKVGAAIAAVPIALLIMIFVSLRGRVFFDLEPAAGGDRVVVRGGRAGLSAFGWLPGSGFGRVVADPGLTRAMVAPEMWSKIAKRDVGADRSDWGSSLAAVMVPQLAGLVAYATTGAEKTLDELRKQAKDPEQMAELLGALRPIARGTPAEIQLVEAAIATMNPAVQRAAVAVAGAAAQRHDGYRETLVRAVTSTDPELRRIAFSAARGLGDRAHAIWAAALSQGAEPAVRRELLAEAAQSAPQGSASASGAAVVLADPDAVSTLAEKARAQLRAALALDPNGTAPVLIGMVAQDRTPAETRIFAAQLLRDFELSSSRANIAEAARSAFGAKSLAVRAAALPLYAKADPERAGGELVTMLDDKKLEKPLRIAAALAWGEVAAANRGAAEKALGDLIKDSDAEIRAAAATAAGQLGRAFQDRLVKMAREESYVARIGAAEGLATTTLAGGSVGVGLDGIAVLWREKGRPRRDAVKIWGRLARKKPFPQVVTYLTAAVVVPEDPSLHPLGAEGLCNAMLAGSAEARPGLRRAADNLSVDVRRIVMSCVASGPDPAKNGAAIAMKLLKDPNSEIRADAARVLALSVDPSKPNAASPEMFMSLLDDPDRDVRMVAIRALGSLGNEAPKTAAAAMAKRFERGDDAEKLTLVRAARLVGGLDLLALAIADRSPAVRIAAVEAALGSGLRTAATLSAALADVDLQVRKAAIERLATGKDNVEPGILDRALALAVRDPDPDLSQVALTTIARVAPVESVKARLRRALASRSERERAQAAAAAIGLVDRDAALAKSLLEPLVADPSRDVRVAMLPALAAAYARASTLGKLAAMIRDSETNAMRRLVAAAAFAMLAAADSASALKQLKAIDGPAMANYTAMLVAGLVTSKSDATAFLQELVP